MKHHQVIQVTSNIVLRHRQTTGFWQVFYQEKLDQSQQYKAQRD